MTAQFDKTKYTVFGVTKSLLLAVILCSNIIRYFISSSAGNLLIILSYVVCIACSMAEKDFRMDTGKLFNVKLVINVLIFFYACVSLIWMNNKDVELLMKFSLVLFLSFCAYSFSIYDIKLVLIFTYIIGLVFSLLSLYDLSSIWSYMVSSGMNYLNMTLSIGLLSTVSLVCFVCSLFKRKIRESVLFAISALILFAALINYDARGTLIFPIIIAVLIAMVIGGKQKFKGIFVFALLVLAGYLAFEYYLDNASAYAISRMTRLFEDTSSESRIQLWKDSIQIINGNLWFCFGGGLDAFRNNYGFYPHSIILQLIGEYGIIGILDILFVSFCLLNRGSRFIKQYTNLTNYHDSLLFFIIMGSLLYYLFTFLKSFSMYDACPLFIFISWIIRIIDKNNSKGDQL